MTKVAPGEIYAALMKEDRLNRIGYRYLSRTLLVWSSVFTDGDMTRVG
ncbi:Protein of unknown function [Pyronema omphalodes CBS 100304]|uniref:Uncharacterized protein n=1 Tax=Pyronema omphalodes (strain CBS 100304) TaxID=1076935 RepID=U4LMD8_PYROM|nr:Protein of unknown function [Pyronema omphalodes CBS 100304]